MDGRLTPGGRFGADLGGNLHKPRYRMIEEPLIGIAEIALPAIVFFIERRPVLHTAAPTDGQVPADKALVAEVCLGSGKSSLFAARGEFFYRRLEDIAQTPLRLNEKVAAEGVARMLDHNILTALPVERTDRVPARDIIRQY